MKLRFSSICAVLWLLSVSSVFAKSMDWSLYNGLLTDHVISDVRFGTPLMTVDYLAIQKDPRFIQVVQQFAMYDVTQLSNREEKLAFYINAYNVLAIKMVLDHWPVESIKDIGSFFSPVWKKNVGEIGGKTVSLDEVEHAILRPMGEPRIHMAIVCASISCPDLRNEAFTASELSAQLDDQTTRFLNNKIKGLFVTGDEVKVSKIFKWFAEDFETYGGVKAYLHKYHPGLAENIVVRPTLNYNWSLNKP